MHPLKPEYEQDLSRGSSCSQLYQQQEISLHKQQVMQKGAKNSVLCFEVFYNSKSKRSLKISDNDPSARIHSYPERIAVVNSFIPTITFRSKRQLAQETLKVKKIEPLHPHQLHYKAFPVRSKSSQSCRNLASRHKNFHLGEQLESECFSNHEINQRLMSPWVESFDCKESRKGFGRTSMKQHLRSSSWGPQAGLCRPSSNFCI